MKKLLILIFACQIAASVQGQQLPLSENYFIDTYSLSSAYAGFGSDHMVFASYRSDWAGIKEGPRTLRVSYNDNLGLNAGFGGKVILDKIGIFQSFFAIGSYSYLVKLSDVSSLRFGLSAGIQQNSINFSEYYNDPSFTADPAMISKDVKSKIKIVNDFAGVFVRDRLQAGVLLSNVGISDYKYTDLDVRFSGFMTCQLHSSYSFPIQDTWTVTPMLIYRLGKNIQNQAEIASQVRFKDKIWGTAALRGKNIICLGFGMDLGKRLLINYTYNLSTATSVSAFQNHEFTVGLRLAEFFKGKKEAESTEVQQ